MFEGRRRLVDEVVGERLTSEYGPDVTGRGNDMVGLTERIKRFGGHTASGGVGSCEAGEKGARDITMKVRIRIACISS